MGQDEAGTLAAVRKLRAEVIEPKIAEHQGRLFKSMGDGFLVEFPSVVNAVACAAAIQTGDGGTECGPARRPADSSSASASTSVTSSQKVATSMATA